MQYIQTTESFNHIQTGLFLVLRDLGGGGGGGSENFKAMKTKLKGQIVHQKTKLPLSPQH